MTSYDKKTFIAAVDAGILHVLEREELSMQTLIGSMMLTTGADGVLTRQRVWALIDRGEVEFTSRRTLKRHKEESDEG